MSKIKNSWEVMQRRCGKETHLATLMHARVDELFFYMFYVKCQKHLETISQLWICCHSIFVHYVCELFATKNHHGSFENSWVEPFCELSIREISKHFFIHLYVKQIHFTFIFWALNMTTRFVREEKYLIHYFGERFRVCVT